MNWKPMYFQSCPEGLCRCPSLCVKWNGQIIGSLRHFVLHFHCHALCVILPGFIFLHTPTRWTETAKKECMQNILEYFLYNSQPTAMWTFGKLTCILFTCHLLLFILSDCCSFVLSPFVKLFLNVYTWFWNCLFCTFNFYNPTVQAFPHDVLKTILF